MKMSVDSDIELAAFSISIFHKTQSTRPALNCDDENATTVMMIVEGNWI